MDEKLSCGDNHSNDDYEHDIACDRLGNAYITFGLYLDSAQYGTTTLYNNSYAAPQNYVPDVAVIKFDPSGNITWVKNAGGRQGEIVQGLCVDQNQNVYVTGTHYSDTLVFASDTLHARQSSSFQQPAFLFKYDANGNEVWARQSQGDSADLPMAITCDSSGAIYFTGLYNSTSLQFGSLPPVMNNGFFDVFTVKYDSNGNALWCASGGNTDDDKANDIAVDNSGNVVVTGSFRSSSIVFGSFTLNNPAGRYDSFVLKYGSNGNVIWAVNDCYAEADLGISLCIGTSNTIWMTGVFTTDLLVFNTDTFSNTSNLYMEIYLVKRDSAGNYMYSTTLAGFGDDQGNHLTADVNGDICLTGYYWNTLDVGPYQLTHGGSGGHQIFIAKIGGLTGFNESFIHKDLIGYPNPVAECITLTGADFDSDADVQLLNAYGQVIDQPVVINRTTTAFQINTSGLASGMYFIEMKTHEQVYIFRFIKD